MKKPGMKNNKNGEKKNKPSFGNTSHLTNNAIFNLILSVMARVMMYTLSKGDVVEVKSKRTEWKIVKSKGVPKMKKLYRKSGSNPSINPDK